MINMDTKGPRIAELFSKAMHPYMVFPLAVALVAYQVNQDIAIWIKWTIIALLSAYVLPLFYIRTKTTAAQTSDIQADARSLFRDQPNQMLLLAALFGIPSALVLFIFGSPSEIIATVISIGLASFVVALVNRVYHASFHLAVFTSMVTPIVIVLNLSWLIVAPLIVMLGLARYYLGKHTPTQLIVGFLIGILACIDVFYIFGLI